MGYNIETLYSDIQKKKKEKKTKKDELDSERLRPKVLALKIQGMGLDFQIKGPKNDEGIKFKDVADELMEYILYKCKRCEVIGKSVKEKQSYGIPSDVLLTRLPVFSQRPCWYTFQNSLPTLA